MEIIFGVNSIMSSNQKLKNGYTMYDWVVRQRCFPEFWGRTLIGENVITTEEIEFLRSRKCKIILVVRDLTEASICRDSGSDDALRAIEAAKTLGVPQNKEIMLLAEVNPEWSINHNWMLSFAYTLDTYGYVPGFIGNTDSSLNFNFDRQSSHYIQALGNKKPFETIFGALEPRIYDMPEIWSPYCPSALNPEDMNLWACGRTTFDEFYIDDVYAKDEKVLKYMW